MERRFPVKALGGLVRPTGKFVDEVLSARADRFLDAHPIARARRQLAQYRETKGHVHGTLETGRA